MKLNELTTALLKKAIRLYLDIAYDKPEDREKHWPGLRLDEGMQGRELLVQFIDESHYTEDVLSQRYVLRLGNRRYPHMKLVVEEFVIPNRYYVGVDTHDQLPVRPDDPEYAAWQELRRFNRDVKEAIEEKWTAEGVPTMYVVRTSTQNRVRRTKILKEARILIVDDEREMGETTKMMLESGGYRVRLASSGQVALDLIKESCPDLVLLDVDMPDMDGYEVCRHIRRNPETCKLPILLATSGPGEMIYTLDADCFLAKPFNKNILLRFVSHVLQSRKRKG